MGATFDTAINTFVTNLQAELTTATVRRNEAFPELLPTTGFISVNDGDPGTPEQLLGGFSQSWYTHVVEIIVMAPGIDASTRDTLFSTLLAGIGEVLEDDLTLGLNGGATGYAAPVPETIMSEDGGTGVKAGSVFVTLEYETSNPLA